MRIKRALGIFAAALVGVALLAPREPAGEGVRFDAAMLPAATALDSYFAAAEAKLPDITPGTAKRMLWAGDPGAQTPLTVVYLHGFSATSQEIAPVPENTARALGANLVLTRLTGHGRSGEALAQASAGDWMRDMDEALTAARKAGGKVLIISVSTGGTLAALAALDPQLSENLAGIVFISPNFQLQNAAAMMLTWPGVRWWGPLVAGKERAFETRNDDHARYWTNRYPFEALLPMAALVRRAAAQDYGQAQVPALFLISPGDTVVSPEATREIAAAWGGPAQLQELTLTPGDDPNNHVLAGNILSPGMTQEVTARITDWAKGL